ncbi:MAG: glucose-6-phosphate dehydrogenase, partial [Rhodobacteraceae bacterium]|nr:glucose-6-phosphate dehydrogenase [Paracoccaceae bacterium]
MAVRVIEVQEFDLVVFGASGDLAHRKLLPALYHRDADGQMPENARIICSARRDYTDDDYCDWARTALQEHVKDLEEDHLARFLKRLRYVKIDVATAQGFEDLKKVLDEREDVIRGFYL